MFKLLSTANPKIQKGTKLGYLSFILHLAPSDLSGKNTCPKATPGCIAACLNTAGRGGMFKKGENTNMIQKARIRKTKYFFENRNAFMQDLIQDMVKAMLQELMQELATSPEHTLMIGDTTHDLQMARHAGVDGLAVCHGAHARDQLAALNPLACLDDTAQLELWLREHAA